jgi:hypothetical protein
MRDDSEETDVSPELALDVPFTFARQPLPVPADMRGIWRAAAIVLMLTRCQGDSASLQVLQALNHAVRSEEGRAAFVRAVAGEPRPEDVLLRLDPTLDRALDLAIGQGWVERRDGRSVRLTDRGREFATVLSQAADLLEKEKEFLRDLPRKVSEAGIQRLLDLPR